MTIQYSHQSFPIKLKMLLVNQYKPQLKELIRVEQLFQNCRVLVKFKLIS